MLRFCELINEHFVNLIGDDPKKHEHKEEAFRLLQHAYKPIGGIHGSGFKSPDDMVKNIPMWKLKKNREGKISALTMYKDKNGRKAVAAATDGTDEGKKHLASIMKADLTHKRSYSEKSGPALSFVKRHTPDGFVKSVALHPDHVKKLMPDEEFRDAPHDDPEVVKHPDLKDHFYQRKIGGEWHTKISLGTPGNSIKEK